MEAPSDGLLGLLKEVPILKQHIIFSVSYFCGLNILNGTAKTPAVNLLRQN